MANITVTTANVRPLFTDKCIIKPRTTAEAVTAGQTAYYTSSGTAGLAGAASAGKHQTAGIFLDTKGSGETARVLEEGWVTGFALASQAYDAPLYQSDTAGALADAAGSATVAVGRVDFLNDNAKTKCVRVCHRPATAWS
jgi:hypothetical protein